VQKVSLTVSGGYLVETPTSKQKFFIGHQIHHKLFNYCGVIIAVDLYFKSDEKWYQVMARSRPPKDKPWYHVQQMDGTRTYVAERNLENDQTKNN
jgi:heat shock protein HspQ